MYSKIRNIAFSFKNKNLLKHILSEHGKFVPYGDSALSTNIIDVKHFNYFIDFDKESCVLHVLTGVLLSEILKSFVPRGWFLRVTHDTCLITVDGAITSDVHGKNHHVAGCFSECVKEFQIMLANDVCASKETFEKCYPFIETFRQLRKSNEVVETFQSLQSKRVGILA